MKFLQSIATVVIGLLVIAFVAALIAGVFGMVLSVMTLYDPLG